MGLFIPYRDYPFSPTPHFYLGIVFTCKLDWSGLGKFRFCHGSIMDDDDDDSDDGDVRRDDVGVGSQSIGL